MSKFVDTRGLARERPFFAESTWEKMRVRGDGPPYSRLRGKVIYDLTDVDAWLAAHKVTSTSDVPVAA